MADPLPDLELTTADLPPAVGPRTVEQLLQRRKFVEEVLEKLMRKGQHFGKVPGADKPSLWKAGAELLLSAFRVSARPIATEVTPLEGGHRAYRVTVAAYDSGGAFLGAAAGECSTAETKYAWRRKASADEWQLTPEEMRHVKFGIGKGGKPYQVEQVRTNPADCFNTCLKMASKRAEVALCLQVFAVSDLFTQDIGDPEEAEPGHGGGDYWDADPRDSETAPAAPRAKAKAKAPEPSAPPPQPKPPQPAPPAGNAAGLEPISREQQKRLFTIATGAGWKADELKAWLQKNYGYDSTSKIVRGVYDRIVEEVSGGGQ